LEIDIYSRPNTTNTTIYYLSNHPTEHKMAAYHFLIHRMTSLLHTKSRKQREWQTITHIAEANGFPTQLLNATKIRLKEQEEIHKHHNKPQKKRITLTYYGPYIRSTSNLFKQADIQVSYRTTGKITDLLRTKPKNNSSEYESSGICSLRCASCHLTYVGQTGRP
jgi:hypothetical protein